jgi:hypothetical protein
MALALLPASLHCAGADTCPTAKKFLTCITPTYTLPNLRTVLLNSQTPRLTVLDFPGNLDLRSILPWNDVITL